MWFFYFLIGVLGLALLIGALIFGAKEGTLTPNSGSGVLALILFVFLGLIFVMKNYFTTSDEGLALPGGGIMSSPTPFIPDTTELEAQPEEPDTAPIPL